MQFGNVLKQKWLAGMALGLVLAFAYAASACNVPVFRFALERWAPAPYRVTVLHRDPLTEAQQALIARLAKEEDSPAPAVHFRSVHIDALDAEADVSLIDAAANLKLPAIVAQYPEEHGIPVPFWTQPLEAVAVDGLMASPVRQELARRLADGQTAVWLVLESGDRVKDEAALAMVEKEVQRLQQELKLPDLTGEPEDALLAAADLRVEFSVLRVARNEQEAALVAMLVHSESDLPERNDPMIFPVFGRGRALFPLVGAGITPENIVNSAAFLVGACSCEVKEQNPGFDLLLAAEWESLLQGQPVTTRNVAAVDAQQGPPELVAIPAGSLAPDSSKASDLTATQPARGWKWLTVGMLLCVAAATWWWRRR